jgi:hypothetical protein
MSLPGLGAEPQYRLMQLQIKTGAPQICAPVLFVI